jgi:isopropylmalate/homocitrate/citramalate synthase
MAVAANGLPGASEIELLDCTLRDGAYAVDFQFEEEFVWTLLKRLNETPVSKVEVGHGLGLEAERAGIKPCNIGHFDWCEMAGSALTQKPWGMFAQPEFTQVETIVEMCRRGLSFVRVGMEPDRVQNHLDYIQRVVDSCAEVYLNLMKSSATPVDELLRALEGVSPGVAGVYVVDSYGAMLPETVHEYVSAVAEHHPVVGFHGHDNLGMANINTITAAESGAKILDGTLNGIGRGSGNAALESLAGVIKLKDSDRFDYQKLAQLAELCRVNMDVIPDDRKMQVLGGVIGIHSGFFPLVEELAEKANTDPARLMETAVEVAEQSPRKADFQAAAEVLAEDYEMSN